MMTLVMTGVLRAASMARSRPLACSVACPEFSSFFFDEHTFIVFRGGVDDRALVRVVRIVGEHDAIRLLK